MHGMGNNELRVGVVGLGPVGLEILRALRRKPWARIAAAVDIAPDKQGRDAGELAGLDRLGVRVTSALTTECDVVAHSTVSSLGQATAQLIELAGRGCSIVSTCEELAFPLDDEGEQRLREAATAHGVTILGTGINPGFLLDTLPLTVSVVCQEVNSIVARRVVDAGQRREPLQRKVGAGLALDEWRRLQAEGRIRHVGLPESLRLLANGLGWTDVEFGEETIEPVVAQESQRTAYLEVRKGQAAGVRQVIAATRGGQQVIRLELEMYVGAKSPADTIAIDGIPAVNLEIVGGVHGDRATAAVVANMMPRVHRAPAGLVTMADVPVGFSG
ncbi:MAG: dihydrodipicolinate reductase [Gemmatimonadetes bacterium]|nr:dihydrodipicolinate reductase [Gemmatimonadota bacterium]